jgi:hypothetical protein
MELILEECFSAPHPHPQTSRGEFVPSFFGPAKTHIQTSYRLVSIYQVEIGVHHDPTCDQTFVISNPRRCMR